MAVATAARPSITETFYSAALTGRREPAASLPPCHFRAILAGCRGRSIRRRFAAAASSGGLGTRPIDGHASALGERAHHDVVAVRVLERNLSGPCGRVYFGLQLQCADERARPRQGFVEVIHTKEKQ